MKKLGDIILSDGLKWVNEFDTRLKRVVYCTSATGRTIIQDMVSTGISGSMILDQQYNGKIYGPTVTRADVEALRLYEADQSLVYPLVYNDRTFNVIVVSVTGTPIWHDHHDDLAEPYILKLELLVV